MSTVVIGAGIVGVCTAFELAKRGEVVTLVDRAGVATATTGLGEGNVLCGDKDAGPELALTVAGLALFDELEADLGDAAAIRRKGSLLVHPDERTWAAEPGRVARVTAAGVEARLVGARELRALEPELTGPVWGASHFVGDLQCDPRAITRALAVRAQALGCELLTETPVRAIALRSGRVVGVRLAGELLEADAVVLAAGPWSGELARTVGLPLPVEPRKGQLSSLRLARADAQFLRHKIVDGSYLLSVAAPDRDRRLSTVIETTADGAIIVGSSRERSGFHPGVDLALAAAMQARAARLIPALADAELDDVWVGFRPWLPDRLPAIGASRGIPGLFVGTGHEGAGVALGPITGRVLARLVRGEPPGVDLDPFDPDRYGARR